MKDIDKICQYLITTKHNKAQIMCIIPDMYCVSQEYKKIQILLQSIYNTSKVHICFHDNSRLMILLTDWFACQHI